MKIIIIDVFTNNTAVKNSNDHIPNNSIVKFQNPSKFDLLDFIRKNNFVTLVTLSLLVVSSFGITVYLTYNNVGDNRAQAETIGCQITNDSTVEFYDDNEQRTSFITSNNDKINEKIQIYLTNAVKWVPFKIKIYDSNDKVLYQNDKDSLNLQFDAKFGNGDRYPDGNYKVFLSNANSCAFKTLTIKSKFDTNLSINKIDNFDETTKSVKNNGNLRFEVKVPEFASDSTNKNYFVTKGCLSKTHMEANLCDSNDLNFEAGSIVDQSKNAWSVVDINLNENVEGKYYLNITGDGGGLKANDINGKEINILK